MQFNPDGSLRLPGSAQARQDNEMNKMKTGKSVLVTRTVLSYDAPKKCLIELKLSDAITETKFVEMFYEIYKQEISTPTKLRRLSDKEFELEVGTDFKRCQDCNKFIGHFRETFPGNLIDKKGNCTYKGHHVMW